MITRPTLFPFLHIGAVVALTATAGLFASLRMAHRGQWLPRVPNEIGTWTATDVPLETSTATALGNPPALGRQYQNTFDEKVDAQVIAVASFDAFHEPAMCISGYGFTMTGQIFVEPFGPGSTARAMVLKHEDSGTRILMLYWVQYQDGKTTGWGDMRAYNDISQRTRAGWETVTGGKQCVIVRTYTRVPLDTNADQARRNLYTVSRGLYESIKNDGKMWHGQGTDGASNGS